MNDQPPPEAQGARTVTASGNVLHQRPPRGWVNSLGLWPLLMPVGIVLLASTLPPQPPYFNTVIYALFTLLCIWRVFNASRSMVVALGDNHMQYVGMGQRWELIYRYIDTVDLVDDVSAFAVWVGRRRGPESLPRYLLLTERSGRKRQINLTWFVGEALLHDLEARLPGRVKRGARYAEVLGAASASSAGPLM